MRNGGRLALHGGNPAITHPLRKWRRFSADREGKAVGLFMRHVIDGTAELSGYLAGVHKPGPMVENLEHEWAKKFKIKHAIACCSATAGLFAATKIARVANGGACDVPALTMSASEVAPQFADFSTYRADVDQWGCAVPSGGSCYSAVVTDLWGHPAQIKEWRKGGRFIISDSAQAVLATDEDGNYAGTTADIGVWSFNVHKQLSCGEGGMIGTNDDGIALALRDIINHGECRAPMRGGLNLRMTELSAVVALCQLEAASELVGSRRVLRDTLVQMLPQPFEPILDRKGCLSACYCLGILVPEKWARDYAVTALQAEGLPCTAGYANELFYSQLPTNAKKLNNRVIVIELCAMDPSEHQLYQIEHAFAKVGGVLNGNHSGDKRQSWREPTERHATD